jgi:hypothetical protein
MVDFRTVLKGIATTTAVTAATLTGGPAAGASLAAYLASPAGQRLLDAAIDESARQNNVQLEDFARGGLVTRPTLGLTGEAGPELVVPLMMKPKKKRSRSARAADKKLSKAFKMANAKYRLKNGSLRKGRTQSDIAKLAHKLRKKM